MPETVFFPIFSVLSGAAIFFVSYGLFLKYQRSGYRPRELSGLLKAGDFLPHTALFLASAGAAAAIAAVPAPRALSYIAAGAFFLVCAGFSLFLFFRPRKVRLRFTKRFWRFSGCFTIIAAGFCCALCFSANSLFSRFLPGVPGLSALAAVTAAAIVTAAALPLALLAHLIVSPLERRIKMEYAADARRTLDSRTRLIKIGITGSFGKTSVKNALKTILSEKYNVCATPENFNTPMGIVRTVSENLLDSDEVFIAEMGARYRNDIAELCAIVAPEIGIITGIGTQHLDTFGSAESLMDAKFELAAVLPESGFAVFNGANAGSRELSGRYMKCQKSVSGAEIADAGGGKAASKRKQGGKTPSGSMSGEAAAEAAAAAGEEDETVYTVNYGGVQRGRAGAEFRLFFGRDEEGTPCTTRLLGKHNMENICLAASVAWRLGMSEAEIAAGIEKIEPVPHRLQVLPSADARTFIIDDSYNASAESIRAAMDVLDGFPSAYKAVITPGVIELGAAQRETNFALGKRIAETADFLVVSGPNSAALSAGALSAGLDGGRIITASTLKESVKAVPKYPNHGRRWRVIIFCNDLP